MQTFELHEYLSNRWTSILIAKSNEGHAFSQITESGDEMKKLKNNHQP
jgi:hypothetical protein